MQDLPKDQTSKADEPPARTPRGGLRIAVGLGLLVLVGAGAYVSFLPLGRAQSIVAAPTSGPSPIGSVTEGIGIGSAAPDFLAADGRTVLLTDFDGAAIRLRDFSGRPLWIVFWATWCTPCQQEASDIRTAFHGHSGDSLAVLAIDIQEPAVAIRAYALAHDLDYTIGLDPSAAVMALYGVHGLPSHVFVDSQGVVRARYSGQLTADLMEQHLMAIVGH